jgi:hypothetical protein
MAVGPARRIEGIDNTLLTAVLNNSSSFFIVAGALKIANGIADLV